LQNHYVFAKNKVQELVGGPHTEGNILFHKAREVKKKENTTAGGGGR